MTTASNPAFPLIDNTWLNQDSAQRLVTIEKIDIKAPGTAGFFLKVAQEDEHEAVRCSAIARIIEFGALEQLQSVGGTAQENAQQQIYRIVAGTLESSHSEIERIEKLEQLSSNGVKQVALITKLKTIGSLAVGAVAQNEDLADICLFAGSVHVRKTAAAKISDTQLLKEILAKVTGKDKTVTRIIAGRLAADSSDGSETSRTATEAEPKTKTDEVAPKAADNPADTKTVKIEKPEKVEKAENVEKVDVPLVEPSIEFEAAEKEAVKLSYKNTARLFEIRSQLRKLQARLTETDTDTDTALAANIEKLQAGIAEKITKNNEFQEQLKAKTEELLTSLAEALEAGNSENATQCWDKIQGNISNTANQVRAELLKKSNVHKEKIIELRDWKIFASTEKKKELITQMQHLIDSKMHASDRSKNISKMHKEWKTLGRSSQNEQLWKEFKKLSDQAYEPCKEYFKERKQQMVQNLLKRREICESLEAEHKLLQEADDEPDISKLNKLLSDSEKDWKSYAPIEQSKIKGLQKRFYETVNQLRKLRKSKLSVSATQKQELVEQAQELSKNDDNKHAMNEAKRLQQEWKKVGPTSYREDQQYWQDFRAACDAIFNKRDQASNALREDLQKIETRLNEILSALDAIVKKEDAAFRESRASYQDLAQEFSNSLDPRIKSQRNRLLDRFNSVKRLIDSRFRALPDKRQQQLMQTILDKASTLQDIEKALLVESDAEKFSSLQQAFDSSAWNKADKSGNAEIDELLNARQSRVSSAKSNSELAKQSKQCEDTFRQLCVEAEVRANVDSPAADKALRMKFQLEQLQSGFGQAKPDPKQNLKYAMSTELQSIALGPLDESTRKTFTARLNEVLQKLR
ncbi:MAG: exonuclease SbcC [Cyclobacteriaceae bacterium]|jgi:exonuclease SbcC